ncbi:DNA (cytosine-5)-methyltransferase PliMCI-like [Dysidea avara]|uniref:DNA (cytosine-5)-methyltransferase PliMCI-like n=1 Tax=Dysidea avara TaxID=196820 RepID=UPI00331A83F6
METEPCKLQKDDQQHILDTDNETKSESKSVDTDNQEHAMPVDDNKAVAGQKRVRCGECTGCISSNCEICKYCRDSPKYGGPGKLKKACLQWKCIKMQKRVDTEMYINKPTLKSSNHQQTTTDRYSSEDAMKKICSPFPWFLKPPGLAVPDMMVPDDMVKISTMTPSTGYTVLKPFFYVNNKEKLTEFWGMATACLEHCRKPSLG